jgi:hypothetical protein
MPAEAARPIGLQQPIAIQLESLGGQIQGVVTEVTAQGKVLAEMGVHQKYMIKAIDTITSTMSDHSQKLDNAAFTSAENKGIFGTWKFILMVLIIPLAVSAMPYVYSYLKPAPTPITLNDLRGIVKDLKDTKPQ